jgi:hypothetical protein
MPALRELQHRFLAALEAGAAAAGTGGEAPADPLLLAAIRDDGALAPPARLEIYAGMYRARLVDVLREDFPRVLTVLGDEDFAALACRYLARCPSTRPSVRHVGERFADFVAGEPGVPAYLGDLARLEWARVEVFDAADAVPLTLADLQAVAPADWPALRFHPVPACRTVASAWPVHRVWAQAAEGPVPMPAPEPTLMRVWREGRSVSHAAMAASEARAFRALERGEPFASLCAALDGGEPEAAAREMGGLLLRWLEDGLLTRGTA